jgi:hypothetical protein
MSWIVAAGYNVAAARLLNGGGFNKELHILKSSIECA